MSATHTAAEKRRVGILVKNKTAPSVRDVSAGQKEDVHMGESGLFHKLVRIKKLESIFLFITSKCNSKCRTCFYHDKLNSKDDMTFDEIRRISETSPKFDKLWLSGGEPFLREELVEIIKLFYDNNGVRVINLPTNGLMGEKIVTQTERLLELCPELTVHLNFSLDGLGRTHDRVRGIPGNFTKTIGTMMSAKSKFRDNPRLLQNVATVITPDSQAELLDIGAYLLKKDLVATHFFEVVRGNPKDPKTKTLTPEQIKALRIKVLPLFERQADNLFKGFTGLKKKFARAFFMGFIKFVNDIQDANYSCPSDWGMSCTAGKTTFVIDHNGDFRSCEMRTPIGNLRDYGFNLTKALYSEAMKMEIYSIGGGKRANCWCTHGCWVMSSLKFSPRAILFRIPAAYRRFNRLRDPHFKMPDIDTAAIERYRP
jgi:MoaA/NifB/PqqE/SkfB family radical SAM enzyme